jgi:hypothetical protein
MARVEAQGIEVERLRGNRLSGVRGDSERETYTRAKATMAIVVSPPSRRRLQPIAPSADWRFDLAEGCPAHCQYCYLAGSLSGPPVTRALRRLAQDGYRVGVTIAPIIAVPDWQAHYGELLNDIAKAVSGIPGLARAGACSRAGAPAGPAGRGHHGEHRGQRGDQGDEVADGEAAHGDKGRGEPNDEDRDRDDGPVLQQQRGRDRGHGCLGVGDHGNGLWSRGVRPGPRAAARRPSGSRPVRDQQQVVGVGEVRGLGHRPAAGRPGNHVLQAFAPA